MLYSMASDGLIYKPLSHVHPRTHTPLLATALGGTIAGPLHCLSGCSMSVCVSVCVYLVIRLDRNMVQISFSRCYIFGFISKQLFSRRKFHYLLKGKEF